jgi:hypothetical protein
MSLKCGVMNHSGVVLKRRQFLPPMSSSLSVGIEIPCSWDIRLTSWSFVKPVWVLLLAWETKRMYCRLQGCAHWANNNLLSGSNYTHVRVILFCSWISRIDCVRVEPCPLTAHDGVRHQPNNLVFSACHKGPRTWAGIGENYTLRSFIICVLHTMLFGWLNAGHEARMCGVMGRPTCMRIFGPKSSG